MKKFFGVAFALALTTALLTGCRSNVSSQKNGRITEPTMMPETVATMPSTDTTPSVTTTPTVSTQPTHETESATHPSTQENTEHTGTATEPNTTEHSTAPGAKARPGRTMG